MAIRLTTLGGLQIHSDDGNGELDSLLGQRMRAALFVYLAVERSVSRESLLALFWPESDDENARHALRQSLYHLRQVLGENWLESRPHELRVSPDIRTDERAFLDAYDRADAETAARLYGGAFLDGVHLVDLASWESWVDARRTQYARAFRKACRDWLDAKRAAGDLRGAIAAAEHWVTREPLDDEAQHRLIQTLADAGERAEAIRQYETYARLLEPDGLKPLDETNTLVARLRSESSPLPTLRANADILNPIPVSHDPRVPRPSSGRWFIGATLAVAVILAAAWGLSRLRNNAAATPTTTTIAVLPFSVRGDASALYLVEGMVNLLGTALDGAASVTPVDTRAVFAALAQQHGAADLADARQVASTLEADLFVLGDIVQSGDRLQLEAAIYDAHSTTQPRARVAVTGNAHALFELVDQLAARLLAELGDPSADRLLRTAAVTTSSLDAFKAYLEGETRMRAGQFETAAESYASALAHDSAFALAYYRLALAREWAPLPGNDEAAQAAARHAARLSARDRALLDAHGAWRAGDAVTAERAYRQILSRYPQDYEAWFQLGEVLFHYGPLLGRPVRESAEVWRDILQQDPRNNFAVPHLARMAASDEQLPAIDSLLTRFTADERRADRRLVEIVLLRALAARDSTAASAAAEQMRSWSDAAVWRVAVFLTAFRPGAADLQPVIAKLLDDYRSPGIRADLLWFQSIMQLADGRVRAAQATLAQASAREATAPAQHRRDAFAAITDWYAATLPLPYSDSMLARLRAHAQSYKTSSDRHFAGELGIGRVIRVEPVRQYTLGILSLRLNDAAAARLAAQTLHGLAQGNDANPLVRDLDRGLRARLAWHDGNAAEALRLLESVELGDTQGDLAATPFVARANERFLRAELLVALHRESDALRWLASLGDGAVSEVPLRAPAQLRQAEIHERLGQRGVAATHYARFIELWRHGDPEFQPLVSAAQRRLAELRRPDGQRQ